MLDLDGDGDRDLVVGFWQSDLDVYYRVEGGFERRQVPSEGTQLSLADLDGDGWQELIVSGFQPRVYSSVGGVLEPGPALPSADGGMLRMLAPADLDGDGDLDLYAPANDPEDAVARRDFLLWNDGAGGFTRDLEALPDAAGGQAFMGIVLDYEGDGDPDVFVDNDMGSQYGPSALLRNEGGALGDASALCACGVSHSGMGGVAADYSGDGLPDLYLSGVGANVLLASRDDGTYADVTLATGASPLGGLPEMAWGAAWLDYDNDGLLDLAVAQGDLWSFNHPGDRFEAPVSLLRQEGGGFVDVSARAGLAALGSFRAVSAADHNGDGVLDLLVSDVVDRPLLYLSEGCTAAGWLAVEAPLGSRVEVEAGGRVQVAWIHPSSGFGAAGPLEAWFGLGDAQVVDRLRVSLPWGAGEYVLEGPLEARRRVRLEAHQ